MQDCDLGYVRRHSSGTPRWQPGSREEGPELGHVSGSYPHLLPATTGSTRRPVLHCFSVSCLNAKFLKGMAIFLFLCLSEAEYRQRSMSCSGGSSKAPVGAHVHKEGLYSKPRRVGVFQH